MEKLEEVSFLGIDIGGTSTKFGRIRGDGIRLSEGSVETSAEQSPDFLLERLLGIVGPWLEESQDRVVGVGIGTPGPLDLRHGKVLEPVNMPGWRHFPLRDEVSRLTGRPVFFANDANAAAFGEFWLGAGREAGSLALLTLGTGVGGGIVIDNHMIPGGSGNAAECGHITVDWTSDARLCSCGQRGHLEAYASATAVGAVATMRASQKQAKGSLLHHWLSDRKKNGNDQLTAFDVYEAGLQEDSLALTIIDETADWLIRGIANIVCTIDPDQVLLGGAMDFGREQQPTGKRFLKRIRQGVAKIVFPQIAENLRMDFAALGGAAGWIGAAGLARQAWREAGHRDSLTSTG